MGNAALRVGIVGRRGLSTLAGLRSVGGVEVTSYVELSAEEREKATREHGIVATFDSMDAMLAGVDAVVIGTPMHLHAEQSLAALSAGKHVLCEVPVAVTLEECEALARAVKFNERVFMIAENYCYFTENLVVREMSRQGMFGEPYFAEGEYVHEVRFLHRDVAGNPTWRMRWQVGIRGNTYITHELGPVSQWFRAADPSIRVTGVACFGSGVHTDPALVHDDTCLTLLQLSNGGLVNIRLDMISNRPHGIEYSFQGTSGVYESKRGKKAWFGANETLGWDAPQRQWKALEDFGDVLPPTLRDELAEAAASGHGGGDYMVGRRFAQAALGQAEAEITAQESLEWTAIGLVSQQSILQNSALLPLPGFLEALRA